MATVNIVFATTGGPSGTASAYNGGALVAQNVTSSGISAQSTATTVPALARIAATGAVYVKTGPDPTAAAGAEWLLPANQSIDLFVNAGDKIAVIDA